mgnify:FL=1
MILVRIILPPVCCCLRFSFRSEYSLFVPYPGQTNAFTLILNVNEQVDIYQHFKYGTISLIND